jgi:predicted enzyme related to lactoylglutathione lyase
MEKALGIGGFFWRSKDPEALGKWYEDNFGILITPKSYTDEPWRQESGTTILAPFKQDSTYISAGKEWMINFRVRDVKAMAAQLEAAGTPVELDPEHYPNGWFAMLKDPEGNNIQLWQEEPFVPPTAA